MPKSSGVEAARKKAFYHEQRTRAEETGDQTTVNKIYGKLHKQAPQVGGTDRVDNAALGLTTFAGGGAAGLLAHLGAAALSRLFPEAAEQIGTHLAAASGQEIASGAQNALGEGRAALTRGRAMLTGGRGDIPAAAPRALPRGSAASRTNPLVKAKTVSRVSKEKNVTPRAPIKARGQTQKALPPGRKTGPDFKQPTKVKAGTPRAKQTSPRAKGTNPRAKAKAKSKAAS